MFNFDIMHILIGALMVFTVFPVRQYARNWMAVKMGDNTPVLEGKLTLNPLAHVDPIGCIFMILIGLGWGRSASINPSNFKCKNRKLGMIAVALAGPVSNILFAFVMALVVIIGDHFGMSPVLIEIFSYITILNINLAVFLLLPVPGFDGGDILMQFLPAKVIWKAAKYFQYISLAMILLLCFGPLRSVVSFLAMYVYKGVMIAAALLAGLFIR